MNEAELLSELIEERIVMLLSDRSEEVCKRSRKTVEEIEKFMDSFEREEQERFEELMDRIAREDSEDGKYLYLNGITDGIRIAKWLFNIKI